MGSNDKFLLSRAEYIRLYFFSHLGTSEGVVLKVTSLPDTNTRLKKMKDKLPTGKTREKFFFGAGVHIE